MYWEKVKRVFRRFLQSIRFDKSHHPVLQADEQPMERKSDWYVS